MTLSQALITQAGPYMLAAKARALIDAEVGKGCDARILASPVALEPVFGPIAVPKDILSLAEGPTWSYEDVPATQDLIRYRVWVSPDQPFDWNCCELFLKQLLWVSHRVGLEIIGNESKIRVLLLCHQRDIPILTTAFGGKFKFCRLSILNEDLLGDVPGPLWDDIAVSDYFPAPPYCHLLTQPDELHSSPYECLVAALAGIPAPAVGILQVLFQPTCPANDWHRNIEVLMDLEYVVRLVANVGHFQRYAQQAPSGDLRQMAGDVETKAHNDKPIYAAAFRLAVVGAEKRAHEHLQSLAVFSSLYQHGGRSLQCVSDSDYRRILGPVDIQQMFERGLTYRPGFLVNSAELTGLAHIPPAKITEHLTIGTDILDTLAVDNTRLLEGTPIGVCDNAGVQQPVCIPPGIRLGHTHLIGRPGMGKSTLEEHMILHDICNDHGVAVLDPHGDLAGRLLALVPQTHVDQVIYFHPSDPYWVPLWNPLQKVPGQDIGRMADDLVGVLKSFVTGWGDRMEHILRHSIFALLHLSGSTLLDIADILRSGSGASEATRKLILEVVDNEEARRFWQHDFSFYRPDEFAPPKHKLSKLLVGGTVALMLSQPSSSFNFRRIMDEGMIFVADLSAIGTEVREILGAFMLAVMHMTALSRSDMPAETRRPFHIYLDEAHRFVTDSLEDTVAETRKYGVSITLAHQYMRQFIGPKIDAISSVGTTIVFNVDTKDASYLCRNFQDRVRLEDIVRLEVGQAIIRCGTDIARIQTLKPLSIPPKHFKEQIIAQSRKRYCMAAPQVRQIIERRGERANKPFARLSPLVGNDRAGIVEEFSYDEH